MKEDFLTEKKISQTLAESSFFLYAWELIMRLPLVSMEAVRQAVNKVQKL